MTAMYLCLNCWTKTPAPDLTFTCPLCKVAPNSHPFARGVGERRAGLMVKGWKKLLGFDLQEVRCPLHPDARATFLCPSCTKPVRADAALLADRMVGLGIAGSKGAGKTMMMLGALPDLAKGSGSGRAFHLLGIGETDTQIGKASADLFGGRIKPRPTPAKAEGRYGWRARAASDADDADDTELLLVMNDLPGEFWSNPSFAPQEEVDRYTRLLDKLVLVLDGAEIAADLRLPAGDAWDSTPPTRAGGYNDTAVLNNLLTLFDARVPKIELALAVSKGDRLWGRREWNGLRECAESAGMAPDEPVRRLLEASNRGSLISHARKFKDYGLFVFSSLGFRPGPKDVDPKNRNRLVRDPAPIGVSAPIRWLLDPASRDPQ